MVACKVYQAVANLLMASIREIQKVKGRKVKTFLPRKYGFLELQTVSVWLAASLPMAHRTVSKVPVSSLPEA